MDKIIDIVHFNEKALFDGAVQLDWLYDSSRNKDVSMSYVFHGPRYHGVKKLDNEYSLIDTASFVNKINSKLYTDNDSNRFILAISSYGTGKSHLSVTLANLFSEGKNTQLGRGIINRIKDADEEIGIEIEKNIGKKNLVLAINGMKDANLNSLLLKSAKLALRKEGIDENILNRASNSFNKAREFIMRSFENNSIQFIDLLEKEFGNKFDNQYAKKYILDNLEDKPEIFEIVNDIYYSLTGNTIENDGAFSAGEILNTLYDKLIIEKKIFNKIIIVFDEFGRFIEYAANYPKASGDSALQQIYEAVQNAHNSILFIGFIQYDIETYIARVVNNPNISKYVGRYKNSEKMYLSSNLETIFANVLVKNTKLFNKYIKNVFDTGYSVQIEKQHKNLTRWIKSMSNREVWKNFTMYKSVIVEGCYPFHPLSIWLLTHLSTWMQDRSAINYLKASFDMFKDKYIEENLQFIYPIDIITENFIKELKGAEDRGLQQSIFCNLYYNIITQIKNSLEIDDDNILKALLIINVLGLKPYDKEDLYLAIEYCSGFSNEKIKEIIHRLENNFGVIEFNPDTNIYDFAIEANGYSEFNKKMIIKRKRRTNSELTELINKDESIQECMQLNLDQVTDFGLNYISSTEWKYSKYFYSIDEIDENLLNYYINQANRYKNIETNRGILLFIYINNDNRIYVNQLSNRIKELGIDRLPIIIKMLDDRENKLYESLNTYFMLMSFSQQDKERFSKFFYKEIEKLKKLISKYFTIAISKHIYLTKDGIKNDIGDTKTACLTRFKEVYYKAIPFRFDGFDKNVKTQAVKIHFEIFTNLINGEYKNKKVTEIVSSDISNRIMSVFGKNIYSSWDAISKEGYIDKPQHSEIRNIFREIEEKLEVNDTIGVGMLFREFLLPPYGMNEYSLTLLIALFIHCHSGRIFFELNNSQIGKREFINNALEKKKISLDRIFKVNFGLLEEDKEIVLDNIIKEGTSLKTLDKCSDFLMKYENKLCQYSVDELYAEKIDYILSKVKKGQEINELLVKRITEFNDLLIEYNTNGKSKTIKGIQIIPNLIQKAYSIKRDCQSDRILGFENDKRITEVNHKLLKTLNDINGFELEKMLLDHTYSDYKEFYKLKTIYEKVAKSLHSVKFINLSDIIRNCIRKIELELDLQEKNRKIIDENRAFIRINNNLLGMNIKELINLKQLISQRIINIKSSSIDGKISKLLCGDLESLLYRIDFELMSHKNKLTEKLLLLYKEEDINEVKKRATEIGENIKYINDIVLTNKYIELENDIAYLEDIINEINSFNRKSFENFKLEKDKNEKNFKFPNIVTNFIIKKEEYWNILELQWYKNNISSIDKNLNVLTIEQLYRNERNLESYPDYMGKENIEEINKLIMQIKSIIKEKNVEGVFDLFLDLDKEQQMKCFSKIQKYLDNK